MGRPKSLDTGIKERLLQFIEYKKLTPFRFCIMCGFSTSYVRNIQKSISTRRLGEISAVFPELNIMWLTSGEGEMLNEVIPISVQNNSCGNNSQQTIIAGTEQRIMTTKEQGEYVISQIRKMEQENIMLKTENSALKTKVEMLQEQVDWLRTLVKQQNQ
jgi:hypothetical protein